MNAKREGNADARLKRGKGDQEGREDETTEEPGLRNIDDQDRRGE